jgi:23S rRNA (adenine2503-C2)-methyltransferase
MSPTNCSSNSGKSLIETVIIRAPEASVSILAQDDLHLHPGGLRDGLRLLRQRAPDSRDLMAENRCAAAAGLLSQDAHAASPHRAGIVRPSSSWAWGTLPNHDNLIRALTIMNADWGLGFGARRITISASGLVPKFLSSPGTAGFRLAVSLRCHRPGATVMPVNRRFRSPNSCRRCARYRQHGRMVTRVHLIEGVNDALEQAEKLRDIARDRRTHVVSSLPHRRRPALETAGITGGTLHDILNAHCLSHLRREKGHDIDLRIRQDGEERGCQAGSAPVA